MQVRNDVGTSSAASRYSGGAGISHGIIKSGSSFEAYLSVADVLKREVTPAEYKDLPEVSESLQLFFKTAEGILRSSPPDLEHVLHCYAGLPDLLRRVLKVVDGLPAPGSKRDPLIGEAFIGLAQEQWTELEKESPKSWFSSVVRAYEPTEDNMDLWTEPSWLKPLKAIVDFDIDATKLPQADYYLSKSVKVGPEFRRVQDLIQETKDRYESIKKGNEASIARGGTAQFQQQELLAKSKYEEAIKQKLDLLPVVSDVFPTKLTEALDRFAIKVIPKENVVRDLVRMAASLETLLVAALIARRKAPTPAIALACPRMKSSNEVAAVSFPVSTEGLSALGRNELRLASLVKTITNYREVIAECMALLPEMPEHARKYLAAPLSTVSTKWVDALTRLLSFEQGDLRSSVAELIGKPIVTNPSVGGWGYLLETADSYPLLSSLISRYLRSPQGLERESYRMGLDSAPRMADGALGLLDTIQSHLDSKRFGRLAKFLNEQVVKLARDGDTLTCLALLASLDCLVSDNSIRTALRHQLPNLEDVKIIGSMISERYEGLAEQISRVVGRSVKGLSQSLEDYYMEGNGGELREAIENFRYFLEHRDCLHGAPANEAIRSAIIIYGPPGVGKSYFVNCLKNDLNVELFALSPSAKNEGEDRLDYTKKVIEKVKVYGKPCILLIDEAEATAVDRRMATITSEDRAVTNYLLTEMDELRRNHPHIFIVFATNYIGQVDPAMRRPGRADLPYEMQPPGGPGRAALIRGALIQHSIDLELSEDEINELVEISDGFTPGRIKLAILETHRVTIPRRKKAEPDLEFSYDIMKEAFKAERVRFERDNALGQIE